MTVERLGFNLFLAMWLGFLAVMITAITAALLWAIRSRQFTNQERARYLALESGISAGGKQETGNEL